MYLDISTPTFHAQRDHSLRRTCGDVVGVIPDINLFTGQMSGIVIVEFAHKLSAVKALQMEGSLLFTFPLRVSLKTALMAQIRNSQQQDQLFPAGSMPQAGSMPFGMPSPAPATTAAWGGGRPQSNIRQNTWTGTA